MKMLGFMIAMTLVYWAVASYAQSVIAAPGACVEQAGKASAACNS